jgi:hypothetical protein
MGSRRHLGDHIPRGEVLAGLDFDAVIAAFGEHLQVGASDIDHKGSLAVGGGHEGRITAGDRDKGEWVEDVRLRVEVRGMGTTASQRLH